MKKGSWILLIACFVTACGVIARPTPTLVPTAAIPSATSTPEPTFTSTPSPTPVPTITLTPVPSVAFYAVEPTIAATASTCKALPDKICVSALIISLTGRQLDEYGVYVTFPGFSGTSFDCPQKALLVSFGGNVAPVICNSRELTFISVGLTELTVTIAWGSGSITETVRPTFDVAAPQGPNCEPHCLVGKAKIHIP